jgi:hypothetical protein
MEVIQQYSDSKPILVFCSTRKQAQDAAQAVLKRYVALSENGEHVPWNTETFMTGDLGNDLLKGCDGSQNSNANAQPWFLNELHFITQVYLRRTGRGSRNSSSMGRLYCSVVLQPSPWGSISLFLF